MAIVGTVLGILLGVALVAVVMLVIRVRRLSAARGTLQ